MLCITFVHNGESCLEAGLMQFMPAQTRTQHWLIGLRKRFFPLLYGRSPSRHKTKAKSMLSDVAKLALVVDEMK